MTLVRRVSREFLRNRFWGDLQEEEVGVAVMGEGVAVEEVEVVEVEVAAGVAAVAAVVVDTASPRRQTRPLQTRMQLLSPGRRGARQAVRMLSEVASPTHLGGHRQTPWVLHGLAVAVVAVAGEVLAVVAVAAAVMALQMLLDTNEVDVAAVHAQKAMARWPKVRELRQRAAMLAQRAKASPPGKGPLLGRTPTQEATRVATPVLVQLQRMLHPRQRREDKTQRPSAPSDRGALEKRPQLPPHTEHRPTVVEVEVPTVEAEVVMHKRPLRIILVFLVVRGWVSVFITEGCPCNYKRDGIAFNNVAVRNVVMVVVVVVVRCVVGTRNM